MGRQMAPTQSANARKQRERSPILAQLQTLTCSGGSSAPDSLCRLCTMSRIRRRQASDSESEVSEVLASPTQPEMIQCIKPTPEVIRASL